MPQTVDKPRWPVVRHATLDTATRGLVAVTWIHAGYGVHRLELSYPDGQVRTFAFTSQPGVLAFCRAAHQGKRLHWAPPLRPTTAKPIQVDSRQVDLLDLL